LTWTKVTPQIAVIAMSASVGRERYRREAGHHPRASSVRESAPMKYERGPLSTRATRIEKANASIAKA